MIILGINAYHADASVVILRDGRLLFAAEEERINRIKHSAGLPTHALSQVLQKTGISMREIDYLTISRDPRANLIPKLQFMLKIHPPAAFLKDRFKVLLNSGKILHQPELLFGKNANARAKGFRTEHHLSHAASAFYPSGFDRAALLTVDGFGDFSSTMFGVGEGNRIKVLKRILFPHSLGVLYTAATQFLGFSDYGDEYKVMGLAGWGEPSFLKQFRELIQLGPKGTFRLNLDYFLHPKGKTDMTWEAGEPILSSAYSEKWQELFGPPRSAGGAVTQRDKDLAATMQAVFEETLFHLLRSLYEKTHSENLCFAGGCAFNSLANGKISDQTPFRKVYIQPAAGDAGTALGSVLYLHHHRLNQPRNFVMKHAYWGAEFSKQEINEQIRMKNEELKKEKCEIREIGDQTILCREGAQALSEGKIIGWFQGRMEWGPRALGNRSILADPRQIEMRETLNTLIKRRENFRPFAPSVLEEKANEWFEMKFPNSPFMNLVFPVRPEKKAQIPAVTHVDGTARVHTISKETNPLFWNLILEFEKISGVPMVLNTSFNENEPIVCAPREALDCFIRTQMNVLVLGPYWIERKD